MASREQIEDDAYQHWHEYVNKHYTLHRLETATLGLIQRAYIAGYIKVTLYVEAPRG